MSLTFNVLAQSYPMLCYLEKATYGQVKIKKVDILKDKLKVWDKKQK